eukprot:CAMPEP_0172315492 /NCGR_PEP_ID=MMETSP1058-20130122/25359_1 /TAXON_ID=83371 /ORGANISM="Detonula confervacea, Strain CCMP 353" /LENGTH=364 /DNA_ID=CAMNT_0013029575 /DNA_START=127 /DNA_END=1221 /DNA_ORIENTATION=+
MGGAHKRNNSTNRLFLASLFIFVIYTFLVNVSMHHLNLSPNCNKEDGRGELPGDTHGNGNNNTKILVVYAGPSSKSARKEELYTKNLEFFLRNGIECNTQDTDTVIVVGHEFYHEYFPWIQRLSQQCRRTSNNKIILIARRNVCYDMEAVRLALYGGVPGLDVPSYDYFLYANCGVTGPGSVTEKNSPVSWTSRFIQLLDDQVKMTGLSMNCEKPHTPHIQSMMYALDKIGLAIVMKSGAIFDCLDPPNSDFINTYERKMGRVILDAGYALRPLIGGRDMVVTKSNVMDCVPCGDGDGGNATELTSCHQRDQYKDIWIKSRLKSIYDGKVPSLEDVVFFKTSRVLTPEIAAQINFTSKVNWNWD